MADDLQKAGLSLVTEGADAFEKTLGDINGVFEAFGNIAVEAASMAADAIGSFFADSFQGALEAEETMARLGQVIESTGEAAGISVSDAEALADQFKSLAGGSDDAVLSIIDMGLRMGTVSEEMMPAFIQSTLDLGAVMGDTGKASQVMSRAIEDPVGTLGALRKAGILVNEETEAQIKAMVKSGDTAGAYALLMDRVGEATEGAAETMANTTAGQWAIFQETIADAGESIVGAFLPALNGILTSLSPVIPLIESFAEKLSFVISDLLSGDIGLAFDDLIEGAIGFGFQLGLSEVQVDAVASTLEDFRDFALNELPVMWSSMVTALQPVIDAAMNVASAFTASMPMIQDTVAGMVSFVIGKFDELSPTIIANVSSTLNSIAEFWTNHGDEIMAVVNTMWQFIVTTIGVAITSITGIVAAGLELLNGDTEGALDILENTFTTVMNSILSLVGTDLETFVSDWSGTFDMVGDVVDIGIAAVGNAILSGLQNAIDSSRAFLVDFLEFGAGIVAGITQGIQDNIADVGNALLGGLEGAIDAAKALLGIASPSRVAMNEIAAPFIAGIVQGIVAGVDKVDMAVGLVADELVRPPASAATIGASYAYSNTDARQFNLNVTTLPKQLTTIIGEFSTLQTLYGGGI